jgi:spore coat polysaccharide biosynthesis predicted glycosyltransferase SpsG
MRITCCIDRETSGHFYPADAVFRPATVEAVIDAVREGEENGGMAVLLVDLPYAEPKLWALGTEHVLTVAIDDHGGRGVAADIVVNQSDVSGSSDYPDAPVHSLILRGLPFLLLRSAFSSAASGAALRNGVGFVVGSGPESAQWVTDLVNSLEVGELAPIRVVVSETLAEKEALRVAGLGRGIHVESGCSAERLRDFYRQTELCVMTGGMALFEAMALSTPVLCYPILEDMIPQAALLADKRGVLLLSDAQANSRELRQLIRSLLEDRALLAAIGDKAGTLVDGQGSARVAAVLERVIHRCLSGIGKVQAVAMES